MVVWAASEIMGAQSCLSGTRIDQLSRHARVLPIIEGSNRVLKNFMGLLL
ncbi:MAG: acyl-CoA dehydrogenase family protein [Synergistaceae bacterium]|jgi:alkylation response protein AidB-like acyl-CoA dehydrogenase|nr:acyl-CoA dehydrogenase family protein [Synergistaceae bacterium]